MLLTLDQFEKKWMGKKCRDGQCVALFRQYMEECHGIPHTGSVIGAINLWTDFEKLPMMGKYFDKIEKDFQPGDAMIYGTTPSNQYGHVNIAIALHSDGIEVIEQDGFKLDGTKPGFWTYKRVVGALRAKA